MKSKYDIIKAKELLNVKNKIIFLTELAENKSICEIIPYIDKLFSENQCLNIINDYFYKEVKKTIYLSKNNQARIVILYREKPDENYESGMYTNTDIYLTGFEDRNGYCTEYSTSNQYYLYSNNIFNDENKIINNVELILKEREIKNSDILKEISYITDTFNPHLRFVPDELLNRLSESQLKNQEIKDKFLKLISEVTVRTNDEDARIWRLGFDMDVEDRNAIFFNYYRQNLPINIKKEYKDALDKIYQEFANEFNFDINYLNKIMSSDESFFVCYKETLPESAKLLYMEEILNRAMSFFPLSFLIPSYETLFIPIK